MKSVIKKPNLGLFLILPIILFSLLFLGLRPRLLFILFALIIFLPLGYVYLTRLHLKKKYWIIIGSLLAAFLIFGLYQAYTSSQTNPQCTSTHTSSSSPPSQLNSASDYLAQAAADYSRSIALNPQYAEAYNNRAYVYMMQNNYSLALPDLDKAIAIRTSYVHALMNRGDIHNFYYQVDRQSSLRDYDVVIAQGPAAYHDTSVCGHRILAKDNGWQLQTYFDFFLFRSNQPGC